MAQAVIVTGANFLSSGLGRSVYLTSDRTSLVGEFIFGRDAATSTYNSGGTGTATAIGTITYSDHYIDAAGANYIKTTIPGATDITMLAVVAPGAAADQEIYLATTSGAGSNGFYLGIYTAGGILSASTTGGAANQVALDSVPAAPLTDFRAFGGRIGGLSNYTLEVDEFKNGARVQSKAVTTTGTRAVDTQTICIGSLNGTTTWNSAKTMSAVLIWHRLLTDAELLAAYGEMRNVLGRMGINC